MKTLLIVAPFVMLAAMTALWARQLKTRNATAVDAVWAVLIGLQTVAMAALATGDPVRRLVIAVLVGGWALRLSLHLYLDRVRTGVEDGRYARFRREWSQGAFYGLYVAQAALSYTLPLTFLGGLMNASPFPSALDVLALAAWAVCVFGEWTADRQLARFRAVPSNKGRTCREGLWRYSRHPNYFFEWLIWCAYIPLAVGSPYAWAALIGPSMLLFFLLKVSGVPPTEAQALASRGDDYRDYQRTTSVFVPWFPKETRP